jgi:hypothetical protein
MVGEESSFLGRPRTHFGGSAVVEESSSEEWTGILGRSASVVWGI